nr:aminopeptidase N [Telchin licus licus]
MAALKLAVLAAACLCTRVFSQEIPSLRSSIFGDELIMENVVTSEITALNDDYRNYRLPTTTKPKHYTVLWGIDFDTFVFGGTVEIDLVATQENVNKIVIHSNDLVISNLQLKRDTSDITVNGTLVPDLHFYEVELESGFLDYDPEDSPVYTLILNFEAPMRTDMYGIYRSWFRNNYTDEVSWMATTQFQATSARAAFPCYDEPSFKATFDITIRRPTTHKSWSCTKINSTITSALSGYEEDIYNTTPVMSTYLLAIIVAEYDSLPPNNPNETALYEVIARPAAIESGQAVYAYEVGQKLLAFMDTHTEIYFSDMDPNLKMTQASIPDFSAGAMENWGLLTYREAYLMYDEEHTNSYFKQLIAYILSHEIVHMWFGNLVTCDWWDVLWLNEGFARYYQYFLTHWVEDYMGLATRFINEQVHTSLLSDSAANAHPLTNTGVGSPASVSAMFSTITYNKGASVIRMTEHLLGFEVHRRGLINYLTDKSFQTALPIDLFQHLHDVAGPAGAISAYGSDFSVIDYYKTWTEQAGHPVINVQVNHQTGDMTIYQRRFDIDNGFSTATNNWIVPITFATKTNPDFIDTKPTHILTESITVINRGTVGDEWVVFNKQQTGFYRVNYDPYTWDLITIALRGSDRTLIHEYNRAQIVNDVFQFARSGLMTYTRAFNILSFLRNETDYAPWVAAMTGFSWLRNRLAPSPAYLTQLEEMIIEWSETVITELSYYPKEDETFMTSYLRYQLAPVLCALNVSECREAAVAQFRALVENDDEVPVDSRNWVYCNALRKGTEEDFTYLWQRYQQHNVYTEKILLLMNLGCTPHATSLYTFLDAIFEENFVIRPQDYTTSLSSAVNGNPGNAQIVFKYIQENLVKVSNAFSSIATPLSYISSRLTTEEEVEEFLAWANDNQEALGTAYQSVVNNAISVRNTFAWVETVSNDLTSYFNNPDQVIEPSSTTTQTPVASTTETQPALAEPEAPELPDSAVTTFLSISVISFAVLANIFF